MEAFTKNSKSLKLKLDINQITNNSKEESGTGYTFMPAADEAHAEEANQLSTKTWDKGLNRRKMSNSNEPGDQFGGYIQAKTMGAANFYNEEYKKQSPNMNARLSDRNSIHNVQNERAVHSPAEKFASKKSNRPGAGRRDSKLPHGQSSKMNVGKISR